MADDSIDRQPEEKVHHDRTDEFAEGVTDAFDPSNMSAMSRKQFLALLAASAAFAAAGCSDYRDRGEIIPYVKKPEGITPGVPNHYASTCSGCEQACGILIKTREGRPIKVDGNPDHPINRGKICAKGQASILNLYDPHRLRTPKHGAQSVAIAWNDVDAEIVHRLQNASQNGKEIAVVTRGIHSPTTKKVLDEFVHRYPTAKIYSYQLFNDENRKHAWFACYGSKQLPVIDWAKAKIVLALESDFLGTEGSVMEQIREFTDHRDVMKSSEFNRLYCVEATMSLTGANADYRLRLRPDAQLEFVSTLIAELGGERFSSALSMKEFSVKHHLSIEVLQNIISDLRQHRGQSIVIAGNVLPEPVHIAVHYLNDVLGNHALYDKNKAAVEILPLSSSEEFKNLVAGMNAGTVSVVIHVDSNPVYHLPSVYGYEAALKSVSLSVMLAESENETSQACTFVLPIHHAFESWGDFNIRSGIYSLQQPVIAPLYDTRQKEAVLLHWVNGGEFKETIYHEFLMNRWQSDIYPRLKLPVDFKTFWYSSLHDGVVEFDETFEAPKAFNKQSVSKISFEAVTGTTVVLTNSYYLSDGTFANNGWLQELPHPISKVVWDNYAAISSQTAQSMGVATNDLITIQSSAGSVTLPVLVQPGQADNTISIALGYGRTAAGPVGNNVGFNLQSLYTKDFFDGEKLLTNVTISKASGNHPLVMTQEFHAFEDEFLKDLHLKRNIIREGTVDEFRSNPNFLRNEKTELFSIAKEVEYKGVKWAMAIDLNKCIGCNACVAGCNVENNIPVVGREQASHGRAMHWLRIDRYYSGTETNPSISHQPMLCQQCDNAPCENVCPVVATNHSPDGLNQMVYNRCVGTKYCSNNCPYKVRRFNFFNWRDGFADGFYEQPIADLVHNPEVTVRSRGVMEKCTFCIQRIMEARQHAIERGEDLKGADVKTACQEACPATAIVFGDMNDQHSEISTYRTHALGYHVLEELNVRPNVTYLAKLRNT
ncbi:MAG TPA: 4Fe-4S dicluster domain-containing protein [Bacteroidota bacterium]|nr:4Fe-4S dicluster domain-containing protein [Bacteroidota bacterium]